MKAFYYLWLMQSFNNVQLLSTSVDIHFPKLMPSHQGSEVFGEDNLAKKKLRKINLVNPYYDPK